MFLWQQNYRPILFKIEVWGDEAKWDCKDLEHEVAQPYINDFSKIRYLCEPKLQRYESARRYRD